MGALSILQNIISNENILNARLKYCFMDKNKVPFKSDNTKASPSDVNDFVDLEQLMETKYIEEFAGVGISIQASNICAIDVDDCFTQPFDLDSADTRALDIIERFMDKAYIEFSFSGNGLRVLFESDLIEHYSKKYYIKNASNGIEYYQPSNSFRYVSVTGRTIIDNFVNNYIEISSVLDFLNTYMNRPIIVRKCSVGQPLDPSVNYNELVKYHYLNNFQFQDVWFSQAPGSGRDESERDFFLISYMFENITTDKEKIKELFESSPFFKSKDSKHRYKWNFNEFRYFNYVYSRLSTD